jgi:hypothetical protein
MSEGQVIVQGTAPVTAVLAVAELLLGDGSLDVPLTEALLLIVDPEGAVTLTTRVIVVGAANASGPREQEIVPVPPTGGVVQVPGLVSETKVVPAGTVVPKVAPLSASGPLFVTVIV